MVHKLINKIDKRKEIILPKNSETSIPTTLKISPNNFYKYKLITVPQQHYQYLKTKIQNFPAINFLQHIIFLKYETKPPKRKNINLINTSTGSYTSYRDNNTITQKQHAPSFLKSDNSSSATHTATQPKKLLRCRKKANNDLIDTNIRNSTYDNNYSIKNTTYRYNSDSSFKLSSNTSSSSIKKLQHNKKDNPSTRLQQTSKI